jgi:hypothetical protein
MRILILALAVAACTPAAGLFRPAAPEPEPAPAEAAAPPARPGGGSLVLASGSDPAALDTTTAEERAAASAPASGGASLGTAVVSLGNPAEQGLWLETPLVSAAGPGRVVLGGQSVQLELRPGSANRLSLAAMRLLGVALTDLPEVEVFSG